MIKPYSPRAKLVLFLDLRPSIRLILYNANMSTDNENQSLMKIYFNNCSESKMAAEMVYSDATPIVHLRGVLADEFGDEILGLGGHTLKLFNLEIPPSLRDVRDSLVLAVPEKRREAG